MGLGTRQQFRRGGGGGAGIIEHNVIIRRQSLLLKLVLTLLWDTVNFFPLHLQLLMGTRSSIGTILTSVWRLQHLRYNILPIIYYRLSNYYVCIIIQGLVVPVLRDATHMNYAQIEKGINELGVKVHLNAWFGSLMAIIIGSGHRCDMVLCRSLPTITMVMFPGS